LAGSSTEIGLAVFEFISSTWSRVSSQLQRPDAPRSLHELLHRYGRAQALIAYWAIASPRSCVRLWF